MFVVASTGRCATLALCVGLDRYSDHDVEHEPEPLLLREAYLKHRRLPYETPELAERLRFFAERDGAPYGLSVRAGPLLPEIRAAAPGARFLVLVRPPLEYVMSAHAKKVLQRGDEWDRFRVMPVRELGGAPLAERLAWHWVEVNRYLLDFAAADAAARIVIVGRLEDRLDECAAFLGVRIRNHERLHAYLATTPNAAPTRELPLGFDERRLREIVAAIWERTLSAASAA